MKFELRSSQVLRAQGDQYPEITCFVRPTVPNLKMCNF